MNSGGSFGSNPLMQHIGIGQATLVDKIEITWPGNKNRQIFKNIKPDISCSIIENNSSIKIIKKNKVDFTLNKLKGVICGEPTS